ncbi:MAG: hypothetical protein KatS3mg115_0189 [Candidatus Poribacteria bacterium]|nr:MAG: hypothetical protein KatS3mg115_0189 [Candidatus Poribacteria bacterium]
MSWKTPGWKRRWKVFAASLWTVLLNLGVGWGPPLWAEEAPIARVHFSFGAVEVLQEGEAEWRFVTPGLPLGPKDRLRMPPVSLLRIRPMEGEPYPLLSGPQEATAAELIQHAEALRSDPRGALAPHPDRIPADEALPVGAAERPAAQEAPQAPLRLTPEQFQKWQSLVPLDDPDLRQEIAAALGPLSPQGYPPLRVAQAQLLWQMTPRLLAQSRLQKGSVFLPGDTDVLFFYTQLLLTAGLSIRRERGPEGRPLLLIESGLDRTERGRLTANRRLLVEEDDRLWVPLVPDGPHWLENWYRGGELWSRRR